MAKPFTVSFTDGASSSTTTLICPHHRQDPSCKPRRRRRKPAVAAARSLAPSPTLLSLLSLVVSASVAEGSPAPPAFLCPSAQQPSQASVRRRQKRDASTPAATIAAGHAKSTVPRAIVRNIADKYEQGEDGIWRRVEKYTLYGVCPSCPKGAVSAIDEQISRPSDSNSGDTTNPTHLDMNLDSNLPDKFPPGWGPREKRPDHEGRKTLILAMSLVLAFVICVFIIACLFWRKSIRRKYKEERDLEGKGKGKARRRNKRLRAEEAREIEMEKECRAKQQLWARATARWRDNARYTARQRRPKRTSIRSRAARSSTSLEEDEHRDGLTSGRSSPTRSMSTSPSRSVSRHASTSSMHLEPVPETPTSPQESSTVPTISLSPPPAPPHSSPPAYQQKALRAEDSSDGLYASDDPTSTSHLIPSRRPSHSSFLATSESDSGDISSIPAAHVATDDKAVLARLADLASAPPSDETGEESSGELPQVSAPEWRDEELEDFMAQEGGGGSDDVARSQSALSPTSPSLFPPPPEKVSLAAPNFYDYPYAFEEIDLAGMEPELGPSAPPFEEREGGAPLDPEQDASLVPSAPPMLDDDDFYVNDLLPSAPELPSPGHADAEEGREVEERTPSGPLHENASDDRSESASQYTNEGPTLPLYRP